MESILIRSLIQVIRLLSLAFNPTTELYCALQCEEKKNLGFHTNNCKNSSQIGCLNIVGLDTVETEVIHLRISAQMQGMLCLKDGTN